MNINPFRPSIPLRPMAIVGFGFVALAVAYSVRAVLGLVMPTWESELGWSRGVISTMAASALIVMAVLAPIAGRLADRYGSRGVLVAGMAALAAGCFVVAAGQHLYVILLAFGGIAAIGFGLVSTHVVSTAVEQEISRNQGLAIGFATSGATAGQFLIVPVVALLLGLASWRFSFAALGVAACVIALIVWRCYPGRAPTDEADTASPVDSLGRDLRYIWRQPAFHLLFWSFLICGYTTSGVIETHFLPFASFCGVGPVSSAAAYGTLSLLNLAGMIGAGWLADRMNRPLLLGGIYVVRGLTFILLAQSDVDVATLYTFAVIFGLVDYSTVPVTASLIASHIGVRVMGLTFGIVTAGHQIGGAAGAYLGGYLFDLYARYDWVWWSSLWLAVAAGAMVFLIREGGRRADPAYA